MAYPYKRNTYQKRETTPTAPATIQKIDISTLTLSKYQSAILDWLNNDTGNGVVAAGPGSGKTFILRLISQAVEHKSAVYLVFGAQNAAEAKDSFSVPASTFHSLCNRAVRAYLYGRTRKNILTQAQNIHTVIDGLYGREHDQVRNVLASLAGKAKLENMLPTVGDDNLRAIMDQYDIDLDSEDYSLRDIFGMVRQILADCMNVDSIARRGAIDFDDQLWLVERFNLKLDTFDYVLVDECQDTSEIRRCIIKRVMHPGSRLIAVGDRCQAIYAFAGATNDALELIVDEFQATVLPMPMSYRCPRAVVELAQRYGDIEVSPNAKDGAILHPTRQQLSDVSAQQLVLCRTTAPLITLAYKMVANRLPVMVRGRDIGKGLKSLITKLAGKRGTLDTLPEKIEAYRAKEVSKAFESRNEMKAQSINDKCDSMLAIIDSLTEEQTQQGIPAMLASIDTLFGIYDKNDAGIQANRPCLSTMHKAKGLEADRVAILDWHLTPHKMAKRPDQKQQEKNLQFVAITRSKDTLTFLTSEALTATE